MICRNLQAWNAYGNHAATTDPSTAPTPDRMEWTQHCGTGPGAEILGDLPGLRIVELGCGQGRNTAYLAAAGARAVGIDGARSQIARARRLWAHIPKATFVHAEAHAYLKACPRVDRLISIFGAFDFAPPTSLLPLIPGALRPAGRLVLSTLHPDDAPRAPTTLPAPEGSNELVRPRLPRQEWTSALRAAGLEEEFMIELPSPPPGLRCLVLSARPPG